MNCLTLQKVCELTSCGDSLVTTDRVVSLEKCRPRQANNGTKRLIYVVLAGSRPKLLLDWTVENLDLDNVIRFPVFSK